VAGSEHVRLFCALRLPDDTLDRFVAWQSVHLGSVHVGRSVRAVVRANLHVTLAFLGARPVGELAAITAELDGAARVAEPIVFAPLRYRETRSVGMVELSDDGGAATALADELGARLERIGAYRREQRPWLPHVTVARFRERPRLELPPPGLGRFSPSDAAVYSSVLRPGGAQYEALESAALGGR
jgi:RNA 2',3'-cyclic 3'-phosphodiesterase